MVARLVELWHTAFVIEANRCHKTLEACLGYRLEENSGTRAVVGSEGYCASVAGRRLCPIDLSRIRR